LSGTGKEIDVMTDEPVPAPSSASLPDAAAHPYMQVWAESMASVLGQIAKAPFAIECLAEAPAEIPPAQDNDLRIVLVAAGALRGEMSLRIPRAAALGVAQLFLGEAQDATAEFKPDYQESVEEWLRQVAGHAATALKSRWGEVQLRLESGAAPSWSPGARGWLASGSGAPGRLWLEWQLSAALQAALTAASRPAESSTRDAPGISTAEDGNLDLLMDVELRVTLRFGECTMLLRDILELGEGSVVELDRQVDEPVDLLLDGKLIARGEVVVVDGNYGLRVHEMLTPLAAG
jgi:flagellar motor switch protein FliN/FliY